jgi:CheY-like chemotaxis protein
MSKKLLLADDSITIQKVIGITFANEDYELTVVDNGDAALEKARSENPDLILADVFMPGKNGYELCAAVRQDPMLRGVPVLLLTGTFEPFDENKARAAGADSWIAKPFESQALIDRVEELLARPQPQAAPAVEPPVAAAVAPAAPASEAAADIWGDLAESGGAEAETVQPAETFAEAFSPAEPLTPAAEEAAAFEEDIWGAVSFDEEDLLAGEPLDETAGDIWGSIEEEVAVAEAPPSAITDESFLFEEESLAEVTPPAEFGAPPAIEEFVFEDEEVPLAPTVAGEPQELEEDILPLDEFDILEEEELAEMAAPPSGEDFAFAGGDEVFPSEPPAAPVGFGEAPDFEEEMAIGEEPIPFEEEFALTEEGPEWGIAEGPGVVAIEPSAPPAGEFFVTPAETAMEPEAVAAPVVATAVEERVRTFSEDELARIVERVAGSVIERLAGSVLEKIAWEVVPDLAENLVKEEIRKIKEGAQ